MKKKHTHQKRKRKADHERNLISINKKVILKSVEKSAAPLIWIFHMLRNEAAWARFIGQMNDLRGHWKLNRYVELYKSESLIQRAVYLACDARGQLSKLFNSYGRRRKQDQEAFANAFILGGIEAFEECERSGFEIESEVPRDLNGDALSEEEAAFRTQYVLFGFIPWAFNLLSVMVHGEKMTSLVPKALAGDHKAYCKAIQVDKNLFLFHPGMVAIWQAAQARQDTKFLDEIHRSLSKPAFRGRIRFPAVYAVFATLESFGWLTKLMHREVMELCDDLKLDRWQNRIESENFISQRLAEYRRFQKNSALSMQ